MHRSSQDLDCQQTSVNEEQTYTSSEEYEAQIKKQVKAYRLSYLFRQSCSSFCQYRQRRTPHGAQIYIVLFLIFLERLAYYSVVSNITEPFLEMINVSRVYRSLIQIVLLDVTAQLMFPIAGFLADRYFGRYLVIHVSLWLLWIGYASMTFISTFDDGSMYSWNRYLLPVCFVVISMGSAGFQANMIPFGADQIEYRASDELSSYFYWYYWVRNLGAILFFISFTCTELSLQLRISVFGIVSTTCITVALVTNQIVKHKFHPSQERYNPMKLVVRVLKFVYYVRRPKYRSAFSYTGVDAPSRMDLAKEIHGGRFTNAQVEDVKTFLRLLLVLLSLMGVLVVYTGVVNVIAVQTRHMNGSFVLPTHDKNNVCSLTDDSVWLFNIGLILITIPILNQCVFPFLREYTPNMQKRIGLGYILTILAPFLLLILSSVGYGILNSRGQGHKATMSCMFNENATTPPGGHVLLPVPSELVLLPHATVSIAEVFVIVASLEFFYAQSPHTMRGMMVGLFFFTWGVSAILANLVLLIFSGFSVTVLTCGIWYYVVLFIVAILTFVLFLFVSRWYKNRRRGDLQPDLYYRNL